MGVEILRVGRIDKIMGRRRSFGQRVMEDRPETDE